MSIISKFRGIICKCIATTPVSSTNTTTCNYFSVAGGNRQIMLSANRAFQFSASPLFRWISWCHSSTKLFVGGLSYDTNEPVLKDVFGQHGEIIEVKVICDHKSGKSKGYGFVHFISEDSACKALAEMDGQLVDGRNIRIQYAHKK